VNKAAVSSTGVQEAGLAGVMAAVSRPLPPQPPAVRGRRALPATAVVVLLVAVASAVVLLRVPGVPPLSRLWAEDGSVFVSQSMIEGGLAAFPEPYAGYLHAVPRLMAAPAVLLPVTALDTWMSGLAVVALALLALLVYQASAGYVSLRWSRLALAASMVLLPVGATETLAVVANLQWYLLPAAVWALLWRPRAASGIGVAAGVVGLTALSHPFALLLAPTVLVIVVAARTRRYLIVPAVWAVGVAVQLTAMVLSRGSRQAGWANAPDVASWLIKYVAGPAVLGDRAWFVPPWVGLAVGAVVLVAFVALLTVVWRRGHARPASIVALLLVVQGFVHAAVTMAIAGLAAPRYAVFPAAMLVSAVIVLVDAAVATSKDRPTQAIVAVWAILGGCALVMALVPPTPAPGSVPWDGALRAAGRDCPTLYDQRIDVSLVPDGWAASLPCDSLR
jgi:hypothetical protein